ncbi:MAG: M48 family metallopeptidase [Propionivibrio sp.]
MSVYENPQIPEGINVSPTHPLKDFALLLGGVSALIVVAVLALSFAAGYLVRFVPFAQEQALASSIDARWLKRSQDAEGKRRERYLQSLGEQFSAAMDLPAEMRITVHYAADDTANAMATLGGNIVVFQGLIDAIDSENALAMVLAHEIAHVRHRHPIVAMGRGFAVMLALSALSGIGDGMIERWVGSMGMLPVLAFSREQEEEADADALQAVLRVYGHADGAASFFEHVAEQSGLPETPALFNTHPDTTTRVARIRDFGKAHPRPEAAALKPLPWFMKAKEVGGGR